jgi:hypothetical protein
VSEANQQAPGEPLLRLRCRGHPAIRASHDKTLELTADTSITARATCVVGVDAELVTQPARRLAGPVRIRISTGDQRAEVQAIANPYWRPGAPMVVRRSRNRTPDTLATEADLAAAALPRGLVARLADPRAEIEVVVDRAYRRADGRAGLVLLWAPPDAPGPRLAAEADAADLVVAEDEAAAALVHAAALVDAGPPAGAGAGPPGGAGAGPPGGVGAGPPGGLAEVLVTGGRALLVSTGELPGAAATAAMRASAVVEVVGLPLGYAAAAASPRRAPVHLAGRLRQRDLRGVLRAVPPASQLVVTVAADELPELLAAAERERMTSTAAVLWAREYAHWGPLAALPDVVPGRGEVVCCLDGSGAPTGGYDPDEALLAALAGQGVSGRTLALALAGLPGWSRRRAYDVVKKLY